MQLPIIIGRPTISFDTIDSTNDYATLLLSNSNPNEGTVIWALYQSKGRGQIGSKWEAEPGDNLLMSVILKPRFLLASQQFVLNIVASLAVRSALEEFEIQAQIKWPNDIYVGNRKICGILVQNILQGKSIKNSVIGIGLNANQKSFDTSLPNPTSILQIKGKSVDLQSLKSTVCRHLQDYYKSLQTDGYNVLKEEYERHLYLKGASAMYTINDETIEGKILGISDCGKLILDEGDKVKEYNLREIKYQLTIKPDKSE